MHAASTSIDEIVVNLHSNLRTKFVHKVVLAYCCTRRDTEHHVSDCATNYLLDLIGRYLLKHSAAVRCSSSNIHVRTYSCCTVAACV